MSTMTVATVESPAFNPIYVPTLPLLNLSDSERVLISRLQSRGWRERQYMELTDSYYRGQQVITNLRIAIPAQLEFLRTVVGWPRIAVDPLVERLAVDSFRLPSATVPDQTLVDIWLDNRMDAHQAFLFTDAFAMGRGWLTVGSPDEPGDAPRMCVESPLNMTAAWDVRSSKPTAVLQTYWLDERRHAALYLPDQTIHIGEDDNHVWQIVDRDMHGFGTVSAVRLANAARTFQRDGASEITAEVMSLTDAACRTLLGLEVAREFYSVPQKVLLGATEENFVNPDGTAKTSWDAYVTKILGLERDENGNLPELHQWQPYDPSVFTKLIDMYASQMAGILAANPQDLGLYTQGNPTSADAQTVVDSRRNRKARHKQRMSNCALVEAMQLALRFTNGGVLPAGYGRISVDWMDPAEPNLAGVTDAMQKQAAMGAIPPTSDAVLKRLGWTEVERAQLAQDRTADPGLEVLAQFAQSMVEKEAHADKTVAADLAPVHPLYPLYRLPCETAAEPTPGGLPMTAPAPTDPTPTPGPAAVPTPPPVPAPVPAPPAALHDDPVIAKALEGLSAEQRETLLTQGGRNALAARAQEVKDAKAAAATAAENAKKELAQQIGKALGLVEDETDPAKLTDALTASQSDAKQAKLELAIYQAAAAAGADPVKLLDSRRFMSTLADIDPSQPDAVQTAIAAAVTADPTLAPSGRLPAPNPAQGTGGTGPTDAGQLTKADVERLSREGKNAEIEQARRDGRLNTLLGIK